MKNNKSELIPVMDTMPVIKMAKEYINQHFCESISLSEVADYCNVNRSYLSNLFHKQLGISYSKCNTPFN